MAQVQVIAPGFGHPASAPAEEGVVGQLLSHGAAHTDHFALEPEPGYQPRSRIRSSTSVMPFGKRTMDGCHSPT